MKTTTSSLAFLQSPAASLIRNGIVPSAAVEQLVNSGFDAVPTSLADLSLADAIAGLALLDHDDGESFLAVCRNPEGILNGQALLALLRELRGLVAQP